MPPERPDASTPDLPLDAIRSAAQAAADAAARVTLAHFRARGLGVDNKDAGGFDPVTVADRDAETAIREVLAQLRPDDGVVGEEHGRRDGTSGINWIIDPIDGTRGFISGTPTWGTLIAATTGAGVPVYGMIDQPYTGERFEGDRARATLSGPRGTVPLSTRAGVLLADAILFSTFPEVGTPRDRAGFEAVAARVRLTRFGMDCYAYALVAAGHADLVIEAGLSNYDVAAPVAVVEAAGGIVTDWQGGPAWAGGQVLAAANAALHAEALAILRDYAG